MVVICYTCWKPDSGLLEEHCGGLNEDGPQSLIDLNAWAPGVTLFERFSRCGLIGESVSLEVDPEVFKSSSQALWLSLPIAYSYFSSTVPATMLPAMMTVD